MACELKRTMKWIDTEDSDMVRALIAAVQELPRWVKVEASGIVSPGPFFAQIGQESVLTDREDRNTVMEPIAGIKILSVFGHQDFRTKIASLETRPMFRDPGRIRIQRSWIPLPGWSKRSDHRN